MAKIATVAFHAVHDKEENLRHYIEYIEKAKAQSVDLIVFPKLSLQAFPPSMAATDPQSALYIHKTAEVIPEGNACQTLIKKAKECNMYICFGMAEQDKERCDVIYNSAVLIGPEGYIGHYRKVHQPGTERLYYFPGNDYYVFDTRIGKIGIMICYDRLYPEAARILKLKGAELILCPTAFPAFEKSENDGSLHIYLISNEMRAIENMVCIVDANTVSEETPDGFEAGHSRILTPMGQTLATTGFEEGMAVAEIDPAEAVMDCVCTSMIGTTNFVKDLRPDTYGELTKTTPYHFMGGFVKTDKETGHTSV